MLLRQVALVIGSLASGMQDPNVSLTLQWSSPIPDIVSVSAVAVGTGAAAVLHEERDDITILTPHSMSTFRVHGFSNPLAVRFVSDSVLEIVIAAPRAVVSVTIDGNVISRRPVVVPGEIVAAAWDGDSWLVASMSNDTIQMTRLNGAHASKVKCPSMEQCVGSAFRRVRLYGGLGGVAGLLDERGLPIMLIASQSTEIKFAAVDVTSELDQVKAVSTYPASWRAASALWLKGEVVALYKDLRSTDRAIGHFTFEGDVKSLRKWPSSVVLVSVNPEGYVGGIQTQPGAEFLMYRIKHSKGAEPLDKEVQ